MRKAILLLAALAAVTSPTAASVITLQAPSVVSGSTFDILVQAQNLFTARAADDLLISYGFNVTVANPSVFSFTGATSGPMFDPSTTEPGTAVFASAEGQHGLGVEPGAAEPLTLATLHFHVLATGSSNIVISSDLSNLFQGLQYFDAPFQESIAGSALVSATPEPAAALLLGCVLILLAKMRRRA